MHGCEYQELEYSVEKCMFSMCKAQQKQKQLNQTQTQTTLNKTQPVGKQYVFVELKIIIIMIIQTCKCFLHILGRPVKNNEGPR